MQRNSYRYHCLNAARFQNAAFLGMQVRYTSVFHVSTLVSQRRGPRRKLTSGYADPAQTPARDVRIAYGGIGIECSTYQPPADSNE